LRGSHLVYLCIEHYTPAKRKIDVAFFISFHSSSTKFCLFFSCYYPNKSEKREKPVGGGAGVRGGDGRRRPGAARVTVEVASGDSRRRADVGTVAAA
jgi:hypothetical protein